MAIPNRRFVSYLRVSTSRQGRSGLGLEAQRKAVTDYLTGGDWSLIGEYVEVESGRKSNRPQLDRALGACRIHSAVLVVAKLDRLARDAHFLLGLRDAGVEFLCCDNPHANRLTIGVLALVAEEEARLTSERTKAALAAAKKRGVKLGTPNLNRAARKRGNEASLVVRRQRAAARAEDLRPVIEGFRDHGVFSLAGIAKELNERDVPASRGGRWSATQVRRIVGLRWKEDGVA